MKYNNKQIGLFNQRSDWCYHRHLQHKTRDSYGVNK